MLIMKTETHNLQQINFPPMFKFQNTNAAQCVPWGAFTYDVRFLGRQVGQAAADFTKQAYVVNYLIRVGRQVSRQVGQKYPKNI